MRVRAAVAIVLSALVAPGTAGAAVEISHMFDDNGDPALIANVAPAGFTTGPTWRVCAPDCGPVVPSGLLFKPGPVAVGTTFEASGTDAGGAVSGRSKPWLGRPTNTTPPSISGEAAIGRSVSASGGTWSAGWGDDIGVAQVQACPTTAAVDCVLLSQGAGPVVVDQIYTGWYLGAIETRYGSGQAFPAIGWVFRPGFLSQYKAPAPGQLVAAGALIGPVPAAPKGSPPADDGREKAAPEPSPTATLRRRAQRNGSRLRLGTIRCKQRCVAKVVVRQGRTDQAFRVVVSSGTRSISVGRKLFRSRVRVFRVTVGFQDSTAVVKGHVKPR